tara:strand:+ start:119 stop:646 length:528 start_codon:yes stop_codon:yes gene_type:complete
MGIEKVNPANRPGGTTAERKRIPMSVPVQRLQTEELPGYHLHWFLGTAERIKRATDGGYEFVDANEMKTNNLSLGGDSAASGNIDMGSQVSAIAGGLDEKGQPSRMILMKIKQEWYDEDQKLLENRNEQVASALRGGLMGAESDRPGDTMHRYVDKAKTAIPDLFKPKHRPRVNT